MMIPETKCKFCGFPRFLSMAFNWHENGTITASSWPWGSNFRAVIHRVSFTEQLFLFLEKRIGVSIDHLAFEAERHATLAVFGPFYARIPLLKTLSHIKQVKRFLLDRSNEAAALIGLGETKTIDFVPGKYGVGLVKNPFDLNLLGSIVAGDFELLEFKPYNVKWEKKDENTYIVRAESAEERSPVSERMVMDEVEDSAWFPSVFRRSLSVVPGIVEHNRCPKCNCPMGLTRFVWTGEGVIRDKVTGARVLILDGYGVSTVFRELASEIGTDAFDIIVDAVKEYTIQNLSEITTFRAQDRVDDKFIMAAFMDYLNSLPVFGHGNPASFEVDDLCIKVAVDNPYNMYILAGTLQGLYESLLQKESKVTWQKCSDVRVACTVEPV